MDIASSCSGPCETCKTYYLGGCLAGHGDDDYSYASPDWIASIGLTVQQERLAERNERWTNPIKPKTAGTSRTTRLFDKKNCKAETEDGRTILQVHFDDGFIATIGQDLTATIIDRGKCWEYSVDGEVRF